MQVEETSGPLLTVDQVEKIQGQKIAREHSCLMMDNKEAWMYYRDDVVEKIDLNAVLKTAESVCSSLGFKLAKSWEVYVTELPKMPWTSIYLTSLELDGVADDLQSRILYAIYYVPCGLKCKDPSAMEIDSQDVNEVQCPERVVRKEEELMDLDLIINDIQNKLYFWNNKVCSWEDFKSLCVCLYSS